MGRPQARWRLMHQSERPCSMDCMRLAPEAGTHATPAAASSAAALKPSMLTNHCEPPRAISPVALWLDRGAHALQPICGAANGCSRTCDSWELCLESVGAWAAIDYHQHLLTT